MSPSTATLTRFPQISGRMAEYPGEHDVVWSFEVVDVQLVPVPLAAGDSRWVAYGTLASAGAAPWPDEPAS